MTGIAEFPRRRKDIVFEDLDQETVIFDAESGKIHALNPTATLVFKQCNGLRGVEHMVDEMTSAFDVKPSRARADVLRVLDTLRQLGLLG